MRVFSGWPLRRLGWGAGACIGKQGMARELPRKVEDGCAQRIRLFVTCGSRRVARPGTGEL